MAEKSRVIRTFHKFIDWLQWGDPLRPAQDLSTLLKFAGAFLNGHQLDWWLECGTLLGCVRHQALIPWDHDLDAGLTAASLARLRSIMQTASLPDGFGYKWHDDGYARLTWREVWIDLVGYAFDARSGSWQPQLPATNRIPGNTDDYYPDYPEAQLFPLGVGLVNGIAYPIPHDPDPILRTYYGNYCRLDPIPLGFSALYHPWKTAAFVRTYWAR